MAVCQFYLRDQCKFGSSCRNEHPVPKPSGFTNTAWGTSNTAAATSSVTFNVESIQRDFGPTEKPLWPISSYGAGKYEPSFLSGLDISPEELRVRAMEALKEGKGAEYGQYEASVIANANNQYARVTSDAKGAFEAAFQLSKSASGMSMPATTPPSGPSTFAFGSSTFGQSTFGQPKPATFGSSTFAFGQPASSTSAFGQPSGSASAFGSTSSAPTFGQSGFGAAAKPSFGSSAFGQPATSAFGASTSGTGAFGSSTSTAGGGFGSSTTGGSGGGFAAFASKPAGFGQATFGQSGFGALAASATGGTPAYAQPDPGAASAFGSSTANQPFGTSVFGGATSTNPLNATGGGFSAFATSGPSGFGSATTAPANPFGQSQPAAGSGPFGGSTTAFGQPAATATNPFGQPATAPQTQGNSLDPPSAFGQSAFGQQAATTSAFGQSSQPTATSVFGQPSQPANPFGQSGSGLSGGFGSVSLNSSISAQNSAPVNPFGSRNPLDGGSAFRAGATAAPASAFGSSAPSASSVFGVAPQSSGPSAQAAAGGTNVFNATSTTAGVTTRTIHDPYVSLLPPNYTDMIPKEVKEAFAKDRFVFGEGEVGVPWWIPPLEMR